MILQNTLKRSVILGFLLLAMSVCLSAQTNNSAELNLGNYFALITPQQLPILDKFKNRDALVKETDYPNGYLLLAHDEWNGWGEMALFKKKSGGDLIVVTQYDCKQIDSARSVVRWRDCAGTVSFLESSGKMLVAAKNVAPNEKELQLYGFYEKKTGQPANSEHKLIYELPRERKDIRIKLSGAEVYSLIWNGEKFEGSYIN